MRQNFSSASGSKPFKLENELIGSFISLQNEYAGFSKNCGGPALLTTVETHTLIHIEENPDITVTELASHFRRTKGAVSQIVKRLERKNCIRRKQCPKDGKRSLLSVSDQGRQISLAHRQLDTKSLQSTIGRLLEDYESSEIETFFKIIGSYNAILAEKIEEIKKRHL